MISNKIVATTTKCAGYLGCTLPGLVTKVLPVLGDSDVSKGSVPNHQHFLGEREVGGVSDGEYYGGSVGLVVRLRGEGGWGAGSVNRSGPTGPGLVRLLFLKPHVNY